MNSNINQAVNTIKEQAVSLPDAAEKVLELLETTNLTNIYKEVKGKEVSTVDEIRGVSLLDIQNQLRDIGATIVLPYGKRNIYFVDVNELKNFGKQIYDNYVERIKAVATRTRTRKKTELPGVTWKKGELLAHIYHMGLSPEVVLTIPWDGSVLILLDFIKKNGGSIVEPTQEEREKRNRRGRRSNKQQQEGEEKKTTTEVRIVQIEDENDTEEPRQMTIDDLLS